MACKCPSAQSYVATVTTNDESGSGAGIGVFQPVARLIRTDGFSSIRFTVEVLSNSGGAVMELAARVSNDGINWSDYFPLSDLGLDPFSSVGWHYFPWVPAGLLPRFVQCGVFAKKTTGGSPAIAQVAVIRYYMEFKPVQLGGS